MDKRKKPLDSETLRQKRADFFDAVDRGELSLQDAVRQMRALSQLTREEFAKHRGVSVRAIKDIELGNGNPTVNTLNRIAEIFGMEVRLVRKKKTAPENRARRMRSGEGGSVTPKTGVLGKPAKDEDADQ